MIAWTIAGSDSGGNAGIQTDLHTFHNLGVHGCSVITAITAQNTRAVENIFYLASEQVDAQLQALEKDLYPRAIKLGMLGNVEILPKLQEFLKRFSGKVVLDPVLISTSGTELFSRNSLEYITALKNLFSWVDLITPNLNEAEIILQKKLDSYEKVELAANDFLA